MMLPSGNDAAIVLAEGFTEIIEKSLAKLPRNQKSLKISSSSKKQNTELTTYSHFVNVMNQTA